MIPPGAGDRGPATTGGTIAVANLHAQIDGLAARGESLALIDLLTLRGHVLGRIADYERAAELAERLVRDGTALLARARTRAAFHRFVDALADLEAAEGHGLDRATLEVAQARHQYRGTSPFPIAALDFRHGLMWYGRGNLPVARTWFDASLRRVPVYAPARGKLAEIDTARGNHQAAIDRLRPVTSSSDDPGYAATLARALAAAGHRQEARQWRVTAAARYDELARRHPQAFAEHVADLSAPGASGPLLSASSG
jgi:tetratricopeptide (TPR) repeat protein